MSKVHLNWRLEKLFWENNFPIFQWSLFLSNCHHPHAQKFSIRRNDEWKYKHNENAFRLLAMKVEGWQCVEELAQHSGLWVNGKRSWKIDFPSMFAKCKNSDFSSVRERNFVETWRKIWLSRSRKKNFFKKEEKIISHHISYKELLKIKINVCIRYSLQTHSSLLLKVSFFYFLLK